jgi:HK97 gp10 family phage protein
MVTKTVLKVDGLRQLGEAMKDLDEKISTRISWSATGGAAKIVKAAAIKKIESNPSIDTGSLHDAVIVKRVPNREREGVTAAHYVTVRGRGKPYNKKGQKVARAPHAFLVEFGTVNMPAEPFLRPALEENQTQAIDEMKRRLIAGIDKATKKAAKG